eukprot:3915086-Amphidinium_carterae.1
MKFKQCLQCWSKWSDNNRSVKTFSTGHTCLILPFAKASRRLWVLGGCASQHSLITNRRTFMINATR